MSRLEDIYRRVTEWQRRTFPNQTAASILAHMRLELKEIEAAPHDIEERADMAILAMGYADRTGNAELRIKSALVWGGPHAALGLMRKQLEWMEGGGAIDLPGILASCTHGVRLSIDGLLDDIAAKMDKNEDRSWPAPEDQVPGEPVEHIQEPVCATCNDSRRMSLGEREVLCTRCPRPCENCRSGGYCRVPRCACKCHMPVERIR